MIKDIKHRLKAILWGMLIFACTCAHTKGFATEVDFSGANFTSNPTHIQNMWSEIQDQSIDPYLKESLCLVAQTQDVNHRLINGETPLFIACLMGYSQIVKALLAFGANVNGATLDGWTPLHIVAQNGNLEILKILLNSPDIRMNQTKTGDETALFIASLNHRPQIVAALLNSGANVNKADQDGWTPLHIAIYGGYVDVIDLLLETNMIDVNALTTLDMSPLHLAILMNSTKTAHDLLHRGADVNQIDCQGSTALYMAISQRNLDMMNILLKSPDIDVNGVCGCGYTPLYVAAQYGYLEIVEVLLSHHRMDVDQPIFNGETALHIAILKGYSNVFFALLEAGADVNQKTPDGWTPLHIAVQNDDWQMAIVLLEQPGILVNAETKMHGLTPLHMAIRLGHTSVAKELLDFGANLHQITDDGKTAFMFARESGHLNAVSLLRSYRGSNLE